MRSWLRGGPDTTFGSHPAASINSRWSLFVVFTIWLVLANAMTPARIAELRKETVDMFYHGFDNYMNVAFPEDEVRVSYEVSKCHALLTSVAETCILHTFNSRPVESTQCRTQRCPWELLPYPHRQSIYTCDSGLCAIRRICDRSQSTARLSGWRGFPRSAIW